MGLCSPRARRASGAAPPASRASVLPERGGSRAPLPSTLVYNLGCCKPPSADPHENHSEASLRRKTGIDGTAYQSMQHRGALTARKLRRARRSTAAPAAIASARRCQDRSKHSTVTRRPVAVECSRARQRPVPGGNASRGRGANCLTRTPTLESNRPIGNARQYLSGSPREPGRARDRMDGASRAR